MMRLSEIDASFAGGLAGGFAGAVDRDPDNGGPPPRHGSSQVISVKSNGAKTKHERSGGLFTGYLFKNLRDFANWESESKAAQKRRA